MRVLIAGGGQVGAAIAGRLVREGNEVVVVEPDPNRCAHLEAALDAQIVEGNAARVLTLKRAGIRDAEMLIAVTDDDEANILACLIAQVESKARIKVARVRTHEVEQWRRVTAEAGLGIDLIIHPESEIAERIMRVVRIPGVSDILDFAGGQVRLFGMTVTPGRFLVDKSLEELREAGPPKSSLVAMIFRGQQVIIPRGAERLREGDHVYTIGTRDNQAELLRFMGLEPREALQRVFVVGGKQIGITVAEVLEQQGVKVKLFERDQRRCEKISTILSRTIVVNGDGTDQRLLEEENVEGVDAYLALTPDDEVNLLAALLARRLGVKKVVALTNRLGFLSTAQRLGIDAAFSPRMAAVDRILQYVRKGRVMSVTTFREEEAEAIELIATEGTRYVGKRLREIRLPRGAIVGAIVRPDGEVLVPRGDDSIGVGDRVIFFSLESVVPELESAFLVERSRGRA
jgi:trk system potassium uptake protein TrkA